MADERPGGRRLPGSTGYATAALACTAILAVALVVGVLFARPGRASRSDGNLG